MDIQSEKIKRKIADNLIAIFGIYSQLLLSAPLRDTNL
jgi:hypothetical protein